MLAQNFKSAEALDLPQDLYDGLIKTLGMLERGELVHAEIAWDVYEQPFLNPGNFNMGTFEHLGQDGCGTARCIHGWACTLAGREAGEWRFKQGGAYKALCFPCDAQGNIADKTVEQAARALRAYLTTGQPDWND